MTEKARLVIWDLDETFWRGTLTEGGITIRPELCQLVQDLAARGIMSSICSKNNFDDVKALLEREGVWDYFVFPSINWEPKGPRVAALIEAVQLRAPTVLFVDDNPMNLAEVADAVPGVEVRSHEFITSIVAGEGLFEGKDDHELTRLKQYKLLETRKRDEVAADGNNADFLRKCDIRVDFERDLEAHIDRVVELINRTNQLNFTKVRLSEDPTEARKQVLELLGRYNIQAGLLRVSDRYGDHGFSGIYIMNSEHNRLLHFAFSCRILGMGVEQWLYNRLGRPDLRVKGEVLNDPKDTSRAVDWINRTEQVAAGAQANSLMVEEIVAHGGCDLSAVAHYFGVHGVKVTSEFNIMRDGVGLRIDHSVFLGYAGSGGLNERQMEAAWRLGYAPEDFRSAIFLADGRRRAILLSFATDAHYALYRHRGTGLVAPYLLGLGPVWSDQRKLDLPPERRKGRDLEVYEYLRAEFDFVGLTQEGEFKDNVRRICTEVCTSAQIFVLRPCDYHLNKRTGEKHLDRSFVNVNRWTAEVAENFPNVTLLDVIDFVRDADEIESILHYDRKVYYRIYETIVNLVGRERAVSQ